MICINWWIYLLVLILSHLYVSQAADICFRGWRLYSPSLRDPDVCIPCHYGEFMPEEKHSLRQCYQCTKIENPQLEILVRHCDRSHDTEIHCIDGYYRTRPSYPHDRGHCNKCTQCLIPKRPCQTFHNTVCCPGYDYRVRLNKTGHAECVRECGPGQFLNPDNDQCLPCPQTTYMDESKHINEQCKKCQIPIISKEKVISHCNATYPTVIACVDGYSREFNNIKVTDHTECIKVCGRGEFVERETETCLPCHENTYMDEDRHTHIDKCKPCEVLKSKNDVILQACNSTHPAVIGCRDGFYRRLSQDLSTSMCAPCRDCSENKDGNIYVGRACGLSENTVCCSQPDMDVMDTLGGPVCVLLNTAAVCGQGEYLSTNASTDSLTCQPCPQGTYMDQTKHSKTSCKSCEEFPQVRFCSDDDSVDVSGSEDGSHESVSISVLVICVVMLMLLAIVLLFIMWRKGYRWRKNALTKRTAGECEKNCEHEMSALTRTDDLVCIDDTETTNIDGKTSTLDQWSEVITSALDQWRHVNRSSISSRPSSTATSESGYSDHTDGYDIDLPSISETSESGDNVYSGIREKAKAQRFNIRGRNLKQSARPKRYLHSQGRSQASVKEPKHGGDVSVSVQVERSSPNRPKYFPGTNIPYEWSEEKYRTMKHTGRGHVYNIKIYNDQPCPCESCQRSESPVMSWGEVVILTKTTVVFDLTEGRNTSCCQYVPDPSNDKKLVSSSFKFSRAVYVSSDIYSNDSYVTFVTHDISLLKQFP